MDGTNLEEDGSVHTVGFIHPDNIRVYDSDGNEVLCVCGKPAEVLISSKIARCSHCIDNLAEKRRM